MEYSKYSIPKSCLPGPLIISSAFPEESNTTERTEYLTVSPIPKDTAIIIELSIRPITINELCPFLLGIFLVPILTRINLLKAPKNITIATTIKIETMEMARVFAGIPNTFSSTLLHHFPVFHFNYSISSPSNVIRVSDNYKSLIILLI